MRYLVTGASGFIGSHVVERLVASGDDVVALVWSRSDADHLPDDVTVAEGDIRDKGSMREPMADVDGVFHLAAWYYVGPGPWNVKRAEQTNVEGTRNVLELMDELDVSKGVYTSTIAVYTATDRGVIDESCAPERPVGAVYDRTKWQAHFEVAKPMADDGLPLVIALPGGVYGPRDKRFGSVRGIFRSYLRGEMPVIPRDSVYAPFDYVEDTARALLLAMDRGEPGESYIVAGEPRSLVEVLQCAEAITGVPVPRTVSPRWFGGLARVMAQVERVVTPPQGMESETLRALARTDLPVDNTKASTELGLEHRPLQEGLREYLDWEMAQSGVEATAGRR